MLLHFIEARGNVPQSLFEESGVHHFDLCSAALVHPISPSSNAKISWYSTSKFRAFSLFSSIQDLRPESSSFSKRTFLLSLTDSPACPSLVHLWVQRAPTVPSATTVPGTSLAATILATAVPFNRTMG